MPHAPQVLRRFQHFGRITLTPPVPIRDLTLLALEVEEAKGEWKVRKSSCGVGSGRMRRLVTCYEKQHHKELMYL